VLVLLGRESKKNYNLGMGGLDKNGNGGGGRNKYIGWGRGGLQNKEEKKKAGDIKNLARNKEQKTGDLYNAKTSSKKTRRGRKG